MKHHMSLGRYLAISIGMVAIPPILIIAGLFWLLVIPQLRSDLGLQQGGLARAIANQASAYLTGGERQLQSVATYLKSGREMPRVEVKELLDANIGQGEVFETIYIATKHDLSISHIGLPEKRRYKRGDLLGLDLSGRGFVARARDAEKPFWSQTFLSTASGRMAIALIIPLANDLLVGEITLNRLSSFISRLPADSGLLIMVLDQRGRIVADSERRREGQQLALGSLPPGVPDQGARFVPKQFSLFDRQFTGTVVNVERLGWKILVAQPSDKAYKSLQAALFIIGLGLAILLLFILAGSWLQARKLSGMFNLFSERAESIARGDYDFKWPGFKTGEFAAMAHALQKMARTIRQRENDLVASETGMRITLDSIGDAVIATDERGAITRMNPMAEKMTGWRLQEARGMHLPDVFRICNAQTGERIQSPVDRILSTGEVVGLADHTMLEAKDGSRYQIADSGAPIRREDGRIVGVVLVFRDVTETYAKDQQIRENEKLLKTISANVPGVTFQFKPGKDSPIEPSYVSPKHAEIFGYEAPTKEIFDEFVRRLPPEDVDRFISSLKTAVKLRSDWQYEGRYLHPSGQTLWIAGEASPQEIDGETVYHGLWMDITEKHRMTEDLRLAKVIFEKASLAIYRIGEGARILEVNDRAVEQTGYSKQELTGMTVYELDPYVDQDSGRASWLQLREKGYDVIERIHRRKDGTEFPVLIARQLIEYNNKEYSLSFVQDITGLKQVEEEARRLESALAQSQKMEAIGTLAGGIAHDFNNILSAVIGFSELALTRLEPESPVKGHLERILSAGLRASKLVRQILTFSRRDKTELLPLQAAPLVKEALKLLRSSLPATIEMSEQIDSGLDNIMSDPTHIHQIVMNLCTNAAHAMEDGGGKLTVILAQVALTEKDVRLHPGLRPAVYLRLSVQDTGCGMSPEVIKKIFEPYFTTKGKGKGTGLGLAVVHGIVSGYGGAVYAYSEPDVGTTVNVYLPTIKAKAVAQPEETSELKTGSEHILVVDDEPDLVEISGLMLEQLGYKVTTALNGIEALELFTRDPHGIDLIFTDLTMPKMTGDKLAKEAMKIRPGIPVVITTGYSINLSEESIAELGIKAVIQKPIVEAHLAKKIREILDAG